MNDSEPTYNDVQTEDIGETNEEQSFNDIEQTAKPAAEMILWNEYEVGDQIGSGTFGQVFKCKHRRTGKIFAIKRFKAKFVSQKRAFE